MRVSYLARAIVACAFTMAAAPTGALAGTTTVLGKADPNSTATFNVFLPLTNQDKLDSLLNDQTDPQSAGYHQWLTPQQFKAQFGPSSSSIAQATAILKAAGLTIVSEKTQNLTVQGSVANVQKFLSTQLQMVKTESGNTKLAAAGRQMVIPSGLAALGAVIPEFMPHLSAQVHSHTIARNVAVPNTRLTSDDSFFYPNDMREAYQFPSFTAQAIPAHEHKAVAVNGAGATIGIVISSVISPTDLASDFNSTIDLGGGVSEIQNFSGNTRVPVPTVTVHEVEGGSGPFSPATNGAVDEASLDTQMSLGTAPGAQEILYDMPDLTLESITAAYVQVDLENQVDVVSSSFGVCELDFTAAANGGTDSTGILKALHQLFQQGNAQGITFLASSGDQGAVPCTSTAFDNNPTNGTNFVLGVSYPASDPAVTAVGGTNLQTAAKPGVDDAAYVSENANFNPRVPMAVPLSATETVTVGNNTWGSGGGFSVVFAKPAYQNLVKTGSNKARSVPDLALMMGGCPDDADLAVQDCMALPHSDAIVWIGGQPDLLIGTSAASPQFAGVLAHAVQLGGRLGNVNTLIYSLSALQTAVGGEKAPSVLQFFHRGISGNNNGFLVKPGDAYSEVLGNSTLVVKNFLGLQFAPSSGAPNTPSNP
jgi:subtilase family serine protease